MATYCEDYPCCGHTPEDPCSQQWYDRPGAFDTSIPGNEHALCEHEVGICNVEPDFDDDDEANAEECDVCGRPLPHSHSSLTWDDTWGLVPGSDDVIS